VRRWVEALTLVTADGETVRLARGERGDGPGPHPLALRRFEESAAPAIRAHAALVAERWPRTRKNSSGYALDAWLASGDLLDLVVGAEGTLGLVTEVEWRLAPIPAATAALRIVLAELERVADVVAALLPLAPSAIELLDRTFLDLIAAADLSDGLRRLIDGAAAVVLVELEADDADRLAYAVEDATRAAAPHAARVETATDAAEIERLWAIRHAASPILASLPAERRSLQVIEDGCVPIERLAEYVRAVRAAGERHGLDVVIFGHAGDGNMHVNLLPELARPDWEAAVAALLADVTEAQLRLGGTPTGEHGDGRLRAPFLEPLYGPEIVHLFGLVRRAFDPHGIFNPDVKTPGAPAPVARLKAGEGAAPIPADVASALRAIERTGGYAKWRMDLV
jgi:FAD/FMN-containing dehydrogenase